MFLSKLVLSGEHYTRTTLPVDYPGGWEAYIQFETDSMKQPYLILALLLIIIAVVFIVSKLPRIQDEEHSGKNKDGKLIDFSVLKRSHLRWGVIAQFFYNGGTDGHQQPVSGVLLQLCRPIGIRGNDFLRPVYAGLPFGALDRDVADG